MKLESLPTDQDFYLNLSKGIKEIYSDSSDSTEIALRGLLGNCPELEVLEVFFSEHVPNMLPFLSINNPKLKEFSLSHIGTYPDLRFSTLKKLSLDTITEIQQCRDPAFMMRSRRTLG